MIHDRPPGLPRQYCVGGCGASTFDLIGADGISIDAGELNRWEFAATRTGHSARCPACQGRE